MPLMLTGEQFEIAAGEYRAVITELGAGLRGLSWRGEPIILSYAADELAPAAFGQLLVPWPNRVDRGRYDWHGRTYQLDVTEPEFDCAIHGLVRWLTWTPITHEPDRVRLGCRLLGSPGYPFRLDLQAEYRLDAESGLTIRLSVENHGTGAAPYGHGAHPYLSVGEPIDDCVVQIPGHEHLPVNERMIPPGPPELAEGTEYDFREGRTLGALAIDRAFTRLDRDAAGRAWVCLRGRTRSVSLWVDDAHPWVEIYTADGVPPEERRLGLGVEPMTCPPNAFASGTDVIALKPGAAFTGSWGIVAADFAGD